MFISIRSSIISIIIGHDAGMLAAGKCKFTFLIHSIKHGHMQYWNFEYPS